MSNLRRFFFMMLVISVCSSVFISDCFAKKHHKKGGEISFKQVSTHNSDLSVVAGAQNVFLFKGKIIANEQDLFVKRVGFKSRVMDGNLSSDFDRIYLYQVNEDGTEQKIGEKTPRRSHVFFSQTDLTVPFDSNGIDLVVRADVKSFPLGTTTSLRWSGKSKKYKVEDSDGNYIRVFRNDIEKSFGLFVNVLSTGSFTLTFDNDAPNLNQDKNVLAGAMSLVGRIKATSSMENSDLENFPIINYGSADNKTMVSLYLFDNPELTGTALAVADLSEDGIAFFENVDLEIITEGTTYFYVGALVNVIDYSDNPGVDATAVAESTIVLGIPSDSDFYNVKTVGQDSGETLSNSGVNHETSTNVSMVMGAVISSLSTDFHDGVLGPEMNDCFSLKIVVPQSENKDYNDEALPAKLSQVIFSLFMEGTLFISDYFVERVGGVNGEKLAVINNMIEDSFGIDFSATYGDESDLEMKPGQVVEYIIRADVRNVTWENVLEVSIRNAFDGDVLFFHNTFSGDSETLDVYPLIPGIIRISGGCLSN